jgi:hypothetical protein
MQTGSGSKFFVHPQVSARLAAQPDLLTKVYEEILAQQAYYSD